MSKIKFHLKKYSLPIVSGFLIGTTYIPFYPWALAFCLVPLWYFWLQNKNSLKTLFIGSWITQFILNLIGFHWIANTAIEFGELPPILGYPVLFIFACLAHLYYPIAALIWSKVHSRVPTAFQYLLIPLIFALCESFYPTIFFWHLGYTWLWIKLPGIHLAEWIGFYGINLLTLFINLGFLYFCMTRKKWALSAALLIFVLSNGLGFWLKSRYVEGDKELNVLVVQGNIGNAIKVQQDRGPRFHQFIVNKFLELTKEGIEKHPETQLVVWPETAYPGLIAEPGQLSYRLQTQLAKAITEFHIPFLIGTYQSLEVNGRPETYNSMVMMGAEDGQVVKNYHKTHLLAFGEYFPGSSIIPQLKDWFPMVSDFGWGSGPTVLPLGENLKIGAQICYESLFDDFSKNIFDQGAQLIVNVTNDSWFGKDFEPYQHLYMTLARAIEFRIPLIRSTNTGISTAIAASGEMMEFSPLHKEWSGMFKVKYNSQQRPTFFSYWAGYWKWLLLGVCLALLAGGTIVKSRDP